MDSGAVKPLIVIVGPTASGKTSLAVDLADQYGGEIICADSRTVYKGMDIGTAKPTKEEQARVRHWGIDLVEPGERFTAAQFKSYADMAIQDIRSRGKIPFLVGGTGLYVDSVIFDFSFGADMNPSERLRLESMSIEALIEYCTNNNVTLPENAKNKRHLVRAIERRNEKHKRKSELIPNCIVVGISTNRSVIVERIESRAEQIFKNNVVEEAMMLGNKYGWTSEAMTGNIYPLVKDYLDGKINETELKGWFVIRDRQLAKRQMTWLYRNKFIQWYNLVDARQFIVDKLTS